MPPKGRYRKLKYFLGSMIALVILACIIPFFLKGPGDTPLITPDQIKLPDIKLPGRKPVDTHANGPHSKAGTPQKATIYRWQDKDGAWHYTDYPNPDGPSQVIHITVDPPSKNEDKPTLEEIHKQVVGDKKAIHQELPFPYSLSEDAAKLKEEAQKLKKELAEKYEELSGLK
jgi:hypothetical protein